MKRNNNYLWLIVLFVFMIFCFSVAYSAYDGITDGQIKVQNNVNTAFEDGNTALLFLSLITISPDTVNVIEVFMVADTATFTINCDADFAANVTIGDSLYIAGNMYIVGDITIGGDLSVVGTTSLDSLNVRGMKMTGSAAVIYEYSTDGTLATNADTTLVTEKAIKTYIDTEVTVNADSLDALGILVGANTDSTDALGILVSANSDSIDALGILVVANSDSSDALGVLVAANSDSSDALGILVSANSDSCDALGILISANQDSLDALGILVSANIDSISDIQTQVNGCFGEMSFSDSSYVLPIAITTWTRVTNLANDLWTAGDIQGVTVAGDTLVVTNTAVYLINLMLSFSGNNGEDWKIRILKNETTVIVATERYTSNNDIGSISVSAIDSGTANDSYEVQIYNATDADDPTIKCGSLTIVKIGY